MPLLPKLESRFGRFAVPNITLILIVGQVFLYIAQYLAQDAGGEPVLERIRLEPAKVLAGEVWRLATFVFDPPVAIPIFALFFWYMLYFMGTTIEANWGAFRYNAFLLVGYLATVAASFATYFAAGGQVTPANNGFLYGTVFLAFARMFPDFVFYIFFVLPVKVKWLAWLQWIIYGLTFLSGDWMIKAMVAASVANYFLFFGGDIWRDAKHGRRRMQHQARVRKTPARLVHQCAICGLNSETSPQTQFRYCSKCDGELCYCPDHLHTHVHILRETSQPPATESPEKSVP